VVVRDARKTKSKDKSSRSGLGDGSPMGKLGDARIRVRIVEAPDSPATVSTQWPTKTSPKNTAMSMRHISFDPFVDENKSSDGFDTFVSDRNLAKPQIAKRFTSVGSSPLPKPVKPQSIKRFASVGSMPLQAKLRASMVMKNNRSNGTLPTVDSAISSGEVCW
jgi:hypothetical protein